MSFFCSELHHANIQSFTQQITSYSNGGPAPLLLGTGWDFADDSKTPAVLQGFYWRSAYIPCCLLSAEHVAEGLVVGVVGVVMILDDGEHDFLEDSLELGLFQHLVEQLGHMGRRIAEGSAA